MSVTLLDAQGNPIGTDSQASDGSGGFGPSFRRFITVGLYNSDFRLLPPDLTQPIDNGANALPYWRVVGVTGLTDPAAYIVPDAASASGYILQFQLNGNGAAADETYIEQIAPVNGTRGISFAAIPSVTFLTGPTVSAAIMYITAVYLAADGVTPVGNVGTSPVLTSLAQGANTIVRTTCSPGDANANIPTNAYFVRVRVGFKRDVAAITVTDVLTVADVFVTQAVPRVVVTDTGLGTGRPVSIVNVNGVIKVGGPLTTTNYGLQAGFADGATLNDGYMFFEPNGHAMLMADGIRQKPITPYGFLPFAYPAGEPSTAGVSGSSALAAAGGSFAVPIFLTAPMLLQSYSVWNQDATLLRTAEARLYVDRLDNAAAINFVPGTDATFSFTATVAASQTSGAVSGAPVVLGPGLHWFVLRNTAAANTFGIAYHLPGLVLGAIQKVNGAAAALGATIDLTGWPVSTVLYVVRLNGRVFGQAAAF